MTVRSSAVTRAFYDAQPYPPVGSAAARRYHLPPLPWLLAIDRRHPSSPRRILVAGCGTGAEACQLQQRLPAADIVGIDFSARSVAIANRARRQTGRASRLRFLCADLTDPDWPRRAGGEFDLIVCHGVLSYIPQPAMALRQLSCALSREGLLYLGLNGSAHFSAGLRPALARLGFELAHLPTGPGPRRVVRLWEKVSGQANRCLSRLPDWYLGGDLFGPVIHNWPLAQWTRLARQTGLHFRASYGALRALRATLADEGWRLLFPRSREGVCELLDLFSPAGFHWLLLSRNPAVSPPWQDPAQLLNWQVAPTGLYRIEWPARTSGAAKESIVVLKSRSLNTRFDWPMPFWESALLRRCGKGASLRTLLSEVTRKPSSKQLSGQLFLLHQFGVLNLVPPARKPTPARLDAL